MLRPVVKARIEEMLQTDPFFSGHDFSLITISEDSDQGPLTSVKIQYLAVPGFFLNATLLRDKERVNGNLEYCFQCEISPGEFGYEQIVKATSLSGLRGVITMWLGRMREDIMLWSSSRALAIQQQQIELVVTKYQDLQERYFSAEKAAQWKRQLAAIEQRGFHQIAAQEGSEEECSKQAAQLRSEIAGLIIKLDAFDNQSWLRSFMGWFFKFSKTPAGQRLVQAGVAAALRELTGGQLSLDPPAEAAASAAGAVTGGSAAPAGTGNGG